jgi:DNA-binding response OmpR family regulator
MNVLLVEDDVGIGRFICQGLRTRGLKVHWERVGKDVPSLARAGHFNAIIMDLLLPDSDGLNLCSQIRDAELDVPILVLTARTSLDDRLDGFSAGADDYLTKPFAFQELLARLQVLLRRDRMRRPDPIVMGSLRVDQSSETAAWAGQVLDLGRRDFAMLLALARARGEVVSRSALIDDIWGVDAEVTDNALDACASSLRRCLARLTRCVAIETVRGRGYVLRVTDEADPRLTD